ncbi:MAG: organic hydroperoxide resistance protein [Cyclobacteriaceae bacterium]
MAENNPTYTASATTVGGRNGRIKTSDGIIDLESRLPKEFGGPGGEYTNPEMLFAAGYSSCYGSAVKLVSEKMGVEAKPEDISVTTDVTLMKDPADGGFKLGVKITLGIDGVDNDKVKAIAEKANEVCPYSKAVRGNVDVEVATK